METQDFPVIAEVDVAVVGGGLAGVAAALASAAEGRETLLIESRPLLGWEATSAFALDWPGAGDDTEAFPAAVRAAGGVRGSRLDAPICEMALERLITASGAEFLLYSTPVALWRDGDRIGGLVVGNKSGRQIVRARAFIDATEEALLWRLAGVKPPHAPPMLGGDWGGFTGRPEERARPPRPLLQPRRGRPREHRPP